MPQYAITLHFRNRDSVFIETDEEHNFGKNAGEYLSIVSDYMVSANHPVLKVRDIYNELHWFRVDDLVRFSIQEYADEPEAVLE